MLSEQTTKMFVANLEGIRKEVAGSTDNSEYVDGVSITHGKPREYI